MTSDPTPILELHPYQKAHVLNPARFTWLNWSRQTGKSTGGAVRRITRGIKRRRNQIFLSAGERQSRELMTKARACVQALQLACEFNETTVFEGASFKQLEITIPRPGIRIIGLPANPMTARGFTGDVFLDEFSMHMCDREIWGSVMPTVLRGEGELDVSATPKGRQNMFYELQQNEMFDHSTVTLLDAVEQGLDVDPEVMRKTIGDDELWRQEFMCEFLDETTSFLTYALIAACSDEGLPRELDVEALADCKGDVFVGIDIGRKHDLTVVWVFEKFGKLMVSLGLIELRSVRFREQIEIISGVLAAKCVRRCCVDSTGLGMQMAEELSEKFGSYRVEPVTFTAAVKEEMAGDLRVRMEDSNLRIPQDDKIRNDLHSMRRTVTVAGNVRLQAPREESHADRFWAAALAVHAAGKDTGPMTAEFGPPLSFAREGTW